MIRNDTSGTLTANCRHKMKYRHNPWHRHETKAQGIRNRASIHELPKEADASRFGDWEMVERSTNFLVMEKLKHGKKATPMDKTVWRRRPYMGEHLKTITTDNGSQFTEYEWIAHRLALDIYFTDAYASWQKGAIENTNKLIRQYITKGTDISTVTDKRIKMIQAKINRRPREKLNFATLKQEFYKYYS